MTYIKPTRRRQTNILDYLITISINTQIEQLQTIEQLYSLIEQLNSTELDKDLLTFSKIALCRRDCYNTTTS